MADLFILMPTALVTRQFNATCHCDVRRVRHPLPMQLRSLCHSFHEVLNRRFPDEALDALGTALFLRFINPALGNTCSSSATSVSAGRLALLAAASIFIGISANSVLSSS